MSPGFMGAVAGGLFGLLNFGILRMIAERIETGGIGPETRTRESRQRTAGILRLVAWVDIPVFAIAGYVVGAYVLG
jgi:hypothetical protein